MNSFMKKFVILGAISVGLVVYFFMGLVIFPQEYLSHDVIEPQPIHTVTISENEISLGKSFEIEIEVENKNDFADILITSVSFPGLLDSRDTVKIITYDFTQSPRHIVPGDKINSDYTLGGEVTATYPSIEAYSRNVPVNDSYKMTLSITPQKIGPFETFIKTIAIPHTTEISHYPYEGLLDTQSEYVSVFSVNVNP